MDLIKSAARRSTVSEFIYIALNILFAIVVFGVSVQFDPPYIAYGIVLLSKWRVLAVRPRFWVANIRANVLDVLVGFSVVTLLWQAHMWGISPAHADVASSATFVEVVIALLYGVWLVVIKPQSRRKWVVIQAAIAQFISIMALMSISYTWPSSLVVLAAAIIGYTVARQALGAYDEPELELMSLGWALLVAELSWVAYHWTIAYDIVRGVLMVPQLSILLTLLGVATIRVYAQYHDHGKIKLRDIQGPLLFVVATIAMLLLAYNGLPAPSRWSF